MRTEQRLSWRAGDNVSFQANDSDAKKKEVWLEKANSALPGNEVVEMTPEEKNDRCRRI